MTELDPVPGAVPVKCAGCDAEYLGAGTLAHNDDGSHTWTPAEDEDEPEPKNDPVEDPEPGEAQP